MQLPPLECVVYTQLASEPLLAEQVFAGAVHDPEQETPALQLQTGAGLITLQEPSDWIMPVKLPQASGLHPAPSFMEDSRIELISSLKFPPRGIGTDCKLGTDEKRVVKLSDEPVL